MNQLTLFSILDPAKDISQPGLGIHTVQLAASGKGKYHSQTSCSLMTPGKEVVLP